jgi:hypothetical protein
MTDSIDALQQWTQALEARHLRDLTFPEVSRALRALSSAYVERRAILAAGGALSGRGKRAAFALFYGPLHYLLVREISKRLGRIRPHVSTLIDLGCGTGAAGAAWAASFAAKPAVVGIDRSAWAVSEALRTYSDFSLRGRGRRGDFVTLEWPRPPAGIVAAFAVNELDAAARDTLLQRLLERARRSDPVLVVEPLARSAAPWWADWRRACENAGGRSDEWRFCAELPSIVSRLDRAARLDHREITGRSLSLNLAGD